MTCYRDTKTARFRLEDTTVLENGIVVLTTYPMSADRPPVVSVEAGSG
jgi:hypothetical protein